MSAKPDVFDYLDYRKFLKDYYIYMKGSSPGFSYRYFAKIANLAAENYLKLVIDGKVHLTKAYRNKFAKGCGLNPKEKKYFFSLIDFNRSKDLTEKNRQLKRIGRLSKKFMQKEIRGDQYKLLSKWYYMVVRSLVTLDDFRPDPKYMARKLRNLITPKQAAEALQVLIEIGLIKRSGDIFELTEKHITTRDEVAVTAGRNFHSQMIPVGVKALHKNPVHEREIRALTLGVSKSKALEGKQQIKNFYRELVARLSEKDEAETPEEIWQLNLQFFKLTKEEVEE